MKTCKKLSWHAAAIAAALVVSASASADQRDRGRWHNDGYYGSGKHQRSWHDNSRRNYGHHRYDRGYRYSRHPNVRYYDYRPQRRYYIYDDGYYYGSSWPRNNFGASLTFHIPLY